MPKLEMSSQSLLRQHLQMIVGYEAVCEHNPVASDAAKPGLKLSR